MRFDFKEESFHAIKSELPKLFEEHETEVQQFKEGPLDIDWDKYGWLQDVGCLRILTVRRDSKLVGYVFNQLAYNIHYKTFLQSYTDIFFMQKNSRQGFTGIKLLKENEKMLREIGVKRIWIISSMLKDIDILLDRLGYNATGIMREKTIGK